MPLSLDQVLALAVFVLITSITPGPNNVMLLASGVNFGLARSLPHTLGISFGLVVMLLAVGLGLGTVLSASPAASVVTKAIAVLYLLWLAWRIAMSSDRPDLLGERPSLTQPLSFLGAALFQWVNPKAWTMALSAVAAYVAPQALMTSLGLMAGVFVIVGLPSMIIWVVFGVGLRGILSDPWRLKAFNVAMALLLVASVAPIAAELIGDIARQM